MLSAKHLYTAQQIWDKINSAEGVLLHFHNGPDGDSVGSNMAMAKILQQLNKQVIIANSGQVGKHYQSYLDTKILNTQSPCLIDIQKFDLHICLDSADLSMACKPDETITQEFKTLYKINIDHHMSNTKYGDLNLILSDVKSTCEVLYQLAKLWKIKLSPEIASCLLLGIVTDTGGFRWQGVNSDTLKTASELMELGGELSTAVWSAYRSIPFKTMKYWQIILQNMEYDRQRKMVLSTVDYTSIQKLGLQVLEYDDTQNVLISNIAETDVGVLIVEKSPSMIGVSFRGRTGKINVGEIATKLGGGGHSMAAGCKLPNTDIKSVKKLILKHIDQEIAASKKVE